MQRCFLHVFQTAYIYFYQRHLSQLTCDNITCHSLTCYSFTHHNVICHNAICHSVIKCQSAHGDYVIVRGFSGGGDTEGISGTHGNIGTKCCLSSSGLMLPFNMAVTSRAATPNGRLILFFDLVAFTSFSGVENMSPILIT